MKKPICLIMIFSMLILKISAQEISEADNSLIDDFVKSHVAVTKEKIISDTLQNVFNGTFFKISAGFNFDENGGSTGYIFAIKGGELFAIENPTVNMPVLSSLVKTDYYLKSETDAKKFETALDKIFPIAWPESDKKEHLKLSNKWYFIRNKFFDSKSGFIVTVDNNSKITDISYEMEAIKK